MTDYLDEYTSGDANKEVVEAMQSNTTAELRNVFVKEFGGGSASDLHELEAKYRAGLPKDSSKPEPVWPERLDIRAKLNALEKFRTEELIAKCPEDLRENYPYAKDGMLITIIKEHVHPIYSFALDALFERTKMLAKLEKRDEAVPESLAVENFSDDWYPPYKEVREVLVKTYQSFSNKVWSGGPTKGLSNKQAQKNISMSKKFL